AAILFLFSLLIGLDQAGKIAAAVLSGKIESPKLAIALVIFILCIAGVKKSITMFKAGADIIIESPTTPGKKIIFQLGNLFLVLAIIAIVYTISLIIYLVLTKSTGVPAGFGLAASMIFFVMGQGLKGLVQVTHNQSLNSTPKSGAN
ncbi:MAG: hypothetical protein DRQ58_04865, partial [Gammaproteobacteria bacterium]